MSHSTLDLRELLIDSGMLDILENVKCIASRIVVERRGDYNEKENLQF